VKRWNSLQITPYRRLVEKAFADAIPLSAQFELTFRCNHPLYVLLQLASRVAAR
jgi:hypothetical protein